MPDAYSIRWVAREILRYEDNRGSLEFECYFDPSERAYTLYVGDTAMRDGAQHHLSSDEFRTIEARLKALLETRRLLGIPFGRRSVHVFRKQTVA
jgi:hypothetical protein